MLIQDSLTGRLHQIPDQLYRSYLGECGRVYGPQYPQGYGHSPHYVQGQVVYDGLGNPVGIAPLLAMLAPLAAKVLPTIAQALPGISSILTSVAPALTLAEASQPPAAMPPTQDQQSAPSPAAPFQEQMPAQMPAPPMTAQPVQPPAPPVMPPPPMAPYPPYPMMMTVTPRMMRGRRRRGHRPIRRRIAVPYPSPVPIQPPLPVQRPPEITEPVREERSPEPSGAVQGWGYYGGFNGYRWR